MFCGEFENTNFVVISKKLNLWKKNHHKTSFTIISLQHKNSVELSSIFPLNHNFFRITSVLSYFMLIYAVIKFTLAYLRFVIKKLFKKETLKDLNYFAIFPRPNLNITKLLSSRNQVVKFHCEPKAFISHLNWRDRLIENREVSFAIKTAMNNCIKTTFFPAPWLSDISFNYRQRNKFSRKRKLKILVKDFLPGFMFFLINDSVFCIIAACVSSPSFS